MTKRKYWNRFTHNKRQISLRWQRDQVRRHNVQPTSSQISGYHIFCKNYLNVLNANLQKCNIINNIRKWNNLEEVVTIGDDDHKWYILVGNTQCTTRQVAKLLHNRKGFHSLGSIILLAGIEWKTKSVTCTVFFLIWIDIYIQTLIICGKWKELQNQREVHTSPNDKAERKS